MRISKRCMEWRMSAGQPVCAIALHGTEFFRLRLRPLWKSFSPCSAPPGVRRERHADELLQVRVAVQQRDALHHQPRHIRVLGHQAVGPVAGGPLQRVPLGAWRAPKSTSMLHVKCCVHAKARPCAHCMGQDQHQRSLYL